MLLEGAPARCRMLASSSCTHRQTRPTGPVIPHGVAGAACPSHSGTGRGPPAPTTPATAGHSRSPAPAGTADSSRAPQSLAAQNIPFRRDPAGQPGHGSAVHNGGYVCGWPRRLDHAPWSASGPVR